MRISIALVVTLAACGGPKPPVVAPEPPPGEPKVGDEPPPPEAGEPTKPPAAACGNGRTMRVAFYDAGQALAALVTLPDGKKILVDAGESPTRPGCGAACKTWNARVLAGLEKDVGLGGRIDMVWNTHPHSDHLGGVPSVAAKFEIGAYVHNGRETTGATAKKAIDAAKADNATIAVVEPGKTAIPIVVDDDVKLIAILPASWPAACGDDPNACSILLRVDYCNSSVLFTGDAEEDEEPLLDVAEASLLQIGHHGSNTSTTQAFVDKVKPKYAVISTAKEGEGTNKGYCHPFKLTIDKLNAVMGGPGTTKMRAFDGPASNVKCNKSTSAHWVDAATSDTVWSTSRDGDVVLTTKGDGKFVREPTQ